jgi:hypothetical protein
MTVFKNCYRGYKLNRESIILNAPEASGIYGLFNALWIFVGEADNLRARLLQHLSEEDPLIRAYQPSGFAFELVSPQGRHQRMHQAIREVEPLLQYSRATSGGERSSPSSGSTRV